MRVDPDLAKGSERLSAASYSSPVRSRPDAPTMPLTPSPLLQSANTRTHHPPALPAFLSSCPPALATADQGHADARGGWPQRAQHQPLPAPARWSVGPACLVLWLCCMRAACVCCAGISPNAHTLCSQDPSDPLPYPPSLPPPLPPGRLRFSWNPFVLGSELCGPKVTAPCTCVHVWCI